MIKIAMLIPTIDQIGGAERQVLMLAAAFAAENSERDGGYQVTVIALSGSGGAAAERLAEIGVCYVSLGMRKAWIDPRGWMRYLDWARVHEPEIVHSHLPHATWFARCVRLISPVRVLIDSIHTSNTGGLTRRGGYRVTDRLTDHVTCVSQSVADAVVDSGMAFRENLSVLPNGVDVRGLGKRCAVIRRNPFQWIAVGRLSPVKDYPTMLRAFATLDGLPVLAIAGTGPDEAAVRQLAEDLAIGDRVRFVGFQADVEPLLLEADAFVLTSLWEGLPVSVLEAQAAGLPVVATDGRGTPEAMLHGRTGLIVPVGDVAGLATAMAAILEMSGEQRAVMGAEGREYVLRNYSMPMIVKRWQQLYAQLLAENPTESRAGKRKRFAH